MVLAADSDYSCTLNDVERDYQKLKNDLGTTKEDESVRQSIKKERVSLNGIDCLIIDTELAASEMRGGIIGRGIIYMLADKTGSVIGQIEGVFYDGAYERNSDCYNAIFASVQLATN